MLARPAVGECEEHFPQNSRETFILRAEIVERACSEGRARGRVRWVDGDQCGDQAWRGLEVLGEILFEIGGRGEVFGEKGKEGAVMFVAADEDGDAGVFSGHDGDFRG